MTILVTGGTGLVGPRLLKRLAATGIEVRALVRPGKELPAGIERVEGDILVPETLPAAVTDVTAVIHLAALFRTRDEDEIWRVNLEGTRNLIAAVQEFAPDARFLMSSTGNVYDDGQTRPGREDDAVSPTLAYPASKIAAEKLLRESGLNWAILRLPFIYGDQDGHLEALPPLAAGMKWSPAQRLSVAHHIDIATAFELALTGAMDGRIVNIADEAPPSVLEMAELIGQTYEPTAEALVNPWKGLMDISVARSLGFQPKVATVYQAVREGLL
jgi:nucleoside-diphosphate-sugar epimerase